MYQSIKNEKFKNSGLNVGLYFSREDTDTGDLTPRTARGLQLVEGLTGPSCEKAYKLCPGR